MPEFPLRASHFLRVFEATTDVAALELPPVFTKVSSEWNT